MEWALDRGKGGGKTGERVCVCGGGGGLRQRGRERVKTWGTGSG